MTTRTRFAPSPTGLLHVGGARTALYSYLVARKAKGQFILRIEDTDLERSTKESVQAILDGMQWLALDYDEGPFYQTKRFDRYREVAQQLLKEGKAYRCDCSKERLEKLRTEQMAQQQKPRYDGHCRNRTDVDPNTPHVIRFKNPIDGVVSWDDLVKGTITFQNNELDDLIIVRSDGAPTYNFTVVVDDYDMKITHVVRGDDHVNNTPRQINILKALNATIPQYAHVPMILGSDGKRLSKRHGAEGVMEYRNQGYLPEALLNYLFRLGFAYKDQEIFSREEMIELFDLKKVSGSPAIFNTEKLNWLNQHYIKHSPIGMVRPYLEWQFAQLHLDPNTGPNLEALVSVMSERVQTLKELAEKSIYFYSDDYPKDAAAYQKHITAETKPALHVLYKELSQLKNFTAPAIHETIQKVASELNLGMGKVGMPLRVALTGSTQSPGIDITCELLGKEKVLQRINQNIALKI
jgi:glutamyl-tRNA synthetase